MTIIFLIIRLSFVMNSFLIHILKLTKDEDAGELLYEIHIN